MLYEERKIKSSKSNLKLHALLREGGHKKWLVCVHGLGEHSMRHDYMFKLFSNYYNVFIFDLRGHGRSEGVRGDVSSFFDYTSDLEDCLKFLRSEYKMDKFVLFGHSMGGLITSLFLNHQNEASLRPQHVYLSSPCYYPYGLLPKALKRIPKGMFSKLAHLNSRVRMASTIDEKYLSHDVEVGRSYVMDELCLNNYSLRLLLLLLDTCRDILSSPLNFSHQMSVAIGDQDKVVDPSYVINRFQSRQSTSFYLQPEGYHELHNEIERIRAPYFEFLKEQMHKYLAN